MEPTAPQLRQQLAPMEHDWQLTLMMVSSSNIYSRYKCRFIPNSNITFSQLFAQPSSLPCRNLCLYFLGASRSLAKAVLPWPGRQGSLQQRLAGHSSWFLCLQARQKSLDHELEGLLASRKCCSSTNPERLPFFWHSDKEMSLIPLQIHPGQSEKFSPNGTSSKNRKNNYYS